MTSIIGTADVAIGVDTDEDEAARIGEYLASHGGPFFELQRRLGFCGKMRYLPAAGLRSSSPSPGAFRFS
jgi:hypothetical protein